MADPSSSPHPENSAPEQPHSTDPYLVQVPVAELSPLADALDVVDRQAGLNHRYRRLISDSRQVMSAERIRLTQARGIAKKLLVLVKAAGPDFRDALDPAADEALRAGLARAGELIGRT